MPERLEGDLWGPVGRDSATRYSEGEASEGWLVVRGYSELQMRHA